MYFVKYGQKYLHDPRISQCMLLDLSLECEENSCGYCDFTIYSTHPLYDQLKERDADNPIEVYDNDKLLFAGFIYELGKEFYMDGHVKCKGELDYLSESIIRPYSTTQKVGHLKAPTTIDGYFEWCIARHNEQVAPNKQFTVGINRGSSLGADNVIECENTSYPTVAGELKTQLIENLNGYLRIRHENGVRYIDLLNEWSDVNSQILDFGVNLTDYTQTDDAVELATVVVPTGARMCDTVYPYNDGYTVTEDTELNSNKIYYTRGDASYSRFGGITEFITGVTYYECANDVYTETSDTTVNTEKQYYIRDPFQYSMCQNLTAFEEGVTYYEYDANQDETTLPLTIRSAVDGSYGSDGYMKNDDYLYSPEAVLKYGRISFAYSNTKITLTSDLITAASIALKEKISPKRTIEIKAVDMHLINPNIKPLCIGEYVRVRSAPHNLDSYFLCVSIDLDLNSPDKSIYTLGTTFDTLTGQQNKIINRLNATINNQYEAVESAEDEVKRVSALIREAFNDSYSATARALEAKTAADNATARVTLVEDSITDIEGNTAEAIAQALAAAEAAGEATAIAEAIGNEIDDVKGDAVSLREGIEDQIETKVTVMTAEYARTTDLTTTTSTLRSEISQSAAAISAEVEQTYAKSTDLSAVETNLNSSLRQNSDSITAAVGEITAVRVDVSTAQSAADAASSAANAAQSAADAAGADATDAQQAAATARQLAEQAQANVGSLTSTVTAKFSEIEQTSESISSSVSSVTHRLDDLSVGTRNLYRGTKLFDGSKWKALGFWVNDGLLESGYKVYSRAYPWSGIYQEIPVVAGEKYTFSFFAKGAGADLNVYTVLNGEPSITEQNGYYIGVATDDWQRYHKEFTVVTDGTLKVRVENAAASTTLYIYGLKLEKGIIPTDWTPAPEDAEDALAASNSRITQTEDSITAAVTEMTSQGSRISTIEQSASGITTRLTNVEAGVGNAAKGATDFLSFSSSGLVVGDMTAGSLGENVRISSVSVDVRNGSTVLASFTPTSIAFAEPTVFTADGILVNNGDAYAYLGRNALLWSSTAGVYMQSGQTINFATQLSRQMSGAVFAWCGFASGVPTNTDWHYFFVPKSHVVYQPGAGIWMTDPYAGMKKYIYVSNGGASGVADNQASGTTNGIAYNNRGYVLVGVVGV